MPILILLTSILLVLSMLPFPRRINIVMPTVIAAIKFLTTVMKIVPSINLIECTLTHLSPIISSRETETAQRNVDGLY